MSGVHTRRCRDILTPLRLLRKQWEAKSRPDIRRRQKPAEDKPRAQLDVFSITDAETCYLTAQLPRRHCMLAAFEFGASLSLNHMLSQRLHTLYSRIHRLSSDPL